MARFARDASAWLTGGFPSFACYGHRFVPLISRGWVIVKPLAARRALEASRRARIASRSTGSGAGAAGVVMGLIEGFMVWWTESPVVCPVVSVTESGRSPV